MPIFRKSSTADIDWYLISIERLKQIGVVIVIVVVAVTGFLVARSRAADPVRRAQERVADAQRALNDLAASAEFTALRSEFDRAGERLSSARVLLGQKKYGEAESAAIESQTIARAALGRQGAERDSDAQFLTAEGNVSFQKGSGGDWRRADPGTALYNGDWVKTGDRASAELIFSNGSLYTVGANALLEIFAAVNPTTSRKENAVKMQIGSVSINTTDDVSRVNTPSTEVTVASESTAEVGVDETAQATRVVTLRGSSSVRSPSSSTPVRLTSGEKVQATKEGVFSGVSKVLLPPMLLAPADNQVYRSVPDMRVEMSWSPQPGASAYVLQVARTRLFSSLEIDARRDATRATARVTSDGVFYWRVASIDANGEIGLFSPFRRFRIAGAGGGTIAAGGDTTPPAMQLKRPFNIGGQYYMMEGNVEPGASVFINDEEIDVSPDGTFRKLITLNKIGWNTVVVKAVDPAGNQTVLRENVHVEE
jgi:hypothetical protein